MTDLSNLIERLEKAEDGSAELDALVHIAAEPDGAFAKHMQGRRGISLTEQPIPEDLWKTWVHAYNGEVSSSLDAAIALVERVLPSWGWYRQPLADGTIYMGVTPKSRQHVPAAGAWSNHPSVCVALCIALLKALQAKEAGQ